MNIKLTTVSQFNLLLSWSPSFFPFDEVPFTYTLFIKNNDGVVIETVRNISSSTSSYLYVGDPTNGCQNVSFTLQSVNEAGESDLSDSVTKALPLGKNSNTMFYNFAHGADDESLFDFTEK